MTPEQYQATLDRNEQAAAEQKAEREASQAEQQRLLEARKNGNTFNPRAQPTFFSLNLEKRAQEAAEREAAEQARLEAITPRDVWFSTLSFAQQQRVTKWEAANPGLAFPMPQNFTVELKGV